jgi:hypothetical protein
MGLMQLLTVGRSLGRILDEPSPYKMTQQSLLPKFGSVNAPEDPARGSGPSVNTAFATTEFEKKKPEIVSATNDRKHMKAFQPSSQVNTAPEAVAPRQAFPRGRWTLFKNPFSKTPKPAATAAPVQSEMALDAVKPVCNDLSDSDLELVQAARRSVERSASVPVPAGEAAVPKPAAPDGVVWDRIKNQFFGAGKA